MNVSRLGGSWAVHSRPREHTSLQWALAPPTGVGTSLAHNRFHLSRGAIKDQEEEQVMKLYSMRTKLLLGTVALVAGVGLASAQGMKEGAGAGGGGDKPAISSGSAGTHVSPGASGRTEGGASSRSEGMKSGDSKSGDSMSERGGDRDRQMDRAERGKADQDRTSSEASRDSKQTKGSKQSAGQPSRESKQSKRSDSKQGAGSKQGSSDNKQTAGSKQSTDSKQTTGQGSRDSKQSSQSQPSQQSQKQQPAQNQTPSASQQGQSGATGQTGTAAQGGSGTTQGQTGTTAQSQTQSQTTLSAQQQTTIRQSVLSARNAPRVSKVNFAINTGVIVPSRVHVASVATFPVLIDAFPRFRDYSFFVVEDEIVFLDRSRRVVEVVPVGPRARFSRGGSSTSVAALHLSEAEIREVQLVLIERHLLTGRPTGIFDARTRTALTKFQRSQGLQVSGSIDTRTVSALGLSSKINATSSQGQSTTTGSGQQPSAQPNNTSQSSTPSSTSGQGTTQQPNSGASSQSQPTTGQGSSANTQHGPNNPPNPPSTSGQGSTGNQTGSQNMQPAQPQRSTPSSRDK